MYLGKLKIRNFRGIKTANILLSQHFILLGNNNSGKSTIIDAIGLLLGKESLVHNIGEYDFYGGNPQPDDRIIIQGVLTGFDSDDISSYGEWFNNNNGGICKWYDEKEGQLFLQQNERKTLKLAIEIGFAARFDKFELEFETKRYFEIGDIDPFEDEVNTINRDLTRKIGFFLLPSKRNWEKIISFGSEIFRKVVDFQNAIPFESICQIRDDLRQNEHGIEKETPFKEIVERINTEIKGFTGGEIKLNFLPTNSDIESVLKSLTPFLNGNNINLPLGCHGSGIISLQTLLLLLEFGRFRKLKEQNFILAAEEPELHLHPGMHRRLVGRIRNLSTQSIITTHSPEIAAYYKPQEINIIHTDNEGLAVVHPLVKNSTPQENALMRLFTIYRKETSEALMNSKVIIPEGISEFHWLNKLVNATITTEGWDAESPIYSFGIIPTQDANIVNTYKTLKPLGNKFYPFVDGDAAGDNYIQQLNREQNKPNYVLQLPAGQFFEHLIAWIILPQTVAEKDLLKNILINDIDYYNVQSLGQLLETNYKTYWKVHDEIIDLIITNGLYRDKAKKIINALNVIDDDTEQEIYNPFWERNELKSEAGFNVLNIKLP